jgi:hypothetical protein
MEALIVAFLGLPLIAIPIFLANAYYWHNKGKKDEEKYIQATTKNCPDCLASITRLAKKCMHCGTIQPDIQVEKQKAITQPAENSTLVEEALPADKSGFAYGARLGLLFGIPVAIIIIVLSFLTY